MRHPALLTGLLATITLVGCSTTSESRASGQGPTTAATAASSSGPATSTDPDQPASATTIRFATGTTTVDVVIDTSSPAAREFLEMLPLTIPFEEFSGREKIGYLPRKLDTSGTPGSDPEDGDLISTTPRGATPGSTTTPPASATPTTSSTSADTTPPLSNSRD